MAGTSPVEAREENAQNEEPGIFSAAAAGTNLIRRMGLAIRRGPTTESSFRDSGYGSTNSACCLVIQTNAFIN